MAVSRIEEKILGRLASQTGPSNDLLSASLFQVLGLSIVLSEKLEKARRARKLDITRDTRSLQLYHHIIWLAREGLSITEVYILPYCQNGEHGAECRVMAAKLRASFYHVFCNFHNHPPISSVSPRTQESRSPPSAGRTSTPKQENGRSRRSPDKSPRTGEDGDRKRRGGGAGFRDPTPSMMSEASYITNPYAGPAQTPPPAGPPPPIPTEARRTPTRPPGLAPINIPAVQASATFLLPPLNFVPMAREHFTTAQHLANTLLHPAHALRLSIALEHAIFLRECEKQYDRAVRLAARAANAVFDSKEGLDDDEFADASFLVKMIAGIVKQSGRKTTAGHFISTPPEQPPPNRPPPIDRTIAVSPTSGKGGRSKGAQPSVPIDDRNSIMRTPERLSTVAEEASAAGTPGSSSQTLAARISRLSNRSADGRRYPQRKDSLNSASDKATKRRAVEQAEELHRRNSAASPPVTGLRQGTPAAPATKKEGYVAPQPSAIPQTYRETAPRSSMSSNVVIG